MAELSVNIGNLQLKNPVMTASGTFGYGIEYADFIDISRLGGIFVKGTTIQPREGNLYPRMAETPSGMLNAVGLQNKGAQYFADHIYPEIKDIDTNMIVNVSGSSVETYVECAEKIAELDRIPAIELNISCPNVKQGGMAFGVTAHGAAEVVRAVRKAYPKTFSECNGYNRDRSGCGSRRCRCCFYDQYDDGYGYQCRETKTRFIYNNWWAFGSLCKACCPANGVADS